MKKQYWLIILPLLFSLFIYLFFRTEKTVINNILITIISFENYILLKENIATYLPLSPLIVYSIPEGLWVFSFTLAAKNLFIQIGEKTINCAYIPLLFAIGLELFQLINLTNGRFDFIDISVSIIFWFIANYLVKYVPEKQNIFKSFDKRIAFFLFTYVIVYLAHVNS